LVRKGGGHTRPQTTRVITGKNGEKLIESKGSSQVGIMKMKAKIWNGKKGLRAVGKRGVVWGGKLRKGKWDIHNTSGEDGKALRGKGVWVN